MSRISVVIPCFNEEEALPVYYRAMCRVMEEMSWMTALRTELFLY